MLQDQSARPQCAKYNEHQRNEKAQVRENRPPRINRGEIDGAEELWNYIRGQLYKYDMASYSAGNTALAALMKSISEVATPANKKIKNRKDEGGGFEGAF